VSAPPDVVVWTPLEQRMSVDPVTKHILIRPSPLCMEKIKEPECGQGVGIMSGKEYVVGEKHLFSGKPWSQLRAESIMCPAKECYAPLSNYIINQCKANNCNEEVNKFKVKLDAIKFGK
jgi:hypothetical protein